MSTSSLLPTQQGSARLIWTVNAENLEEHREQIFRSSVSGLCMAFPLLSARKITSFLKQATQWYQKNALPMPAMILSLDTLQNHHVAYPLEARPVAFADRVWMYGSTKDITPEERQKASENHAVVIQVSLDRFPGRVAEGDSLFLGYGDCVLRVMEVTEDKLVGEVSRGGMVKKGMALYLPEAGNMKVNLKDVNLSDLVNAGVNYFLLPGCFSVSRIRRLREEYPRDRELSPWFLYRVDSLEAMEKLPDVMRYVDGVMISRRELALTASPDLVPLLTKELINRCRDQGKLTIVASQMLASMSYQMTPTRAEVSDVANAVYDGADAVLLAAEMLQGPYATAAVDVARKVMLDVEADQSAPHQQGEVWHIPDPDGEMDVICMQAAKTALRIKAKALVCITKTGNTAVRLSSIDTRLPIIAITFHQRICRKLRLLRGVQGMVLKASLSLDEVLPRVNELLKNTSWLKKGDKIVFVTVTLSSMSHESSNLFTVQSLY